MIKYKKHEIKEKQIKYSSRELSKKTEHRNKLIITIFELNHFNRRLLALYIYLETFE